MPRATGSGKAIDSGSFGGYDPTHRATMKVRLLRHYYHDGATRAPGAVVELDAALAATLIHRGIAGVLTQEHPRRFKGSEARPLVVPHAKTN